METWHEPGWWPGGQRVSELISDVFGDSVNRTILWTHASREEQGTMHDGAWDSGQHLLLFTDTEGEKLTSIWSPQCSCPGFFSCSG